MNTSANVLVSGTGKLKADLIYNYKGGISRRLSVAGKQIHKQVGALLKTARSLTIEVRL